MLDIPEDLNTWPFYDIQTWLQALVDDPDVTDAEFVQAQHAAKAAMENRPHPDQQK
ncbi:hypothetical protein [Streptomyces sp. NPDC056132]|uniref:hypothetical protein n=1 Tax=Streptomyces sp. NPDC056132 TaxID=3345722 RepID=UPI0035E1C6DC